MTCEKILVQLDNYLDGTLPEADVILMDSHVKSCASCRSVLSREHEFRAKLAGYAAPEVDSHFADTVFETVRRTGDAEERSMWKAGGIGAIAASLMLFVITAVVMPVYDRNDIPSVSLALHEKKNINLIFNATDNIVGAQMSLELPSHLELEGHPGQRKLVWNTNLHKGNNNLVLPIVALRNSTGEVKAQIRYGDTVKTFQIRQNINTGTQKGDKKVKAEMGTLTVI